MSLHAVRSIPLAFWALALALLPILTRVIDAFWQMPIGSGDAVGLHDPDSWLRLTLVRDWLQGSSWYDHNYLSNTPNDPIVSPWTRPLDLVIAGFAQLQWGELTARLTRTALLLPLLWMGLIVAAQLFIVRRLTTMPHAIPLVGVLLVTAPINYNYFGPGNADHHAPLSVLFCWIVALMLNHDARRGNGLIAIGLMLALMLWISPEAILIIALVYGWFGLQWLVGASLKPLARIATVTALASVAAVMIERPPGEWLLFTYDSLSIAQIMPLGLVALACVLLARITSFFWLWRGLAAAALLSAIGIALYSIDPKFFMGPMAEVDAYIRSDFLPRIKEATHAWNEPALKLIGLLIQPLLACFVLFRCATQRQGIIAPGKAAALLYLLLATGALYMVQLRWAYYFFPLVPLVLAPYLAAWLNPQRAAVSSYWPANRLRRLDERQIMTRRIPLLLVTLALPSVLILVSAALNKKHESKAPLCHAAARELMQNGELTAIKKGKSLNVFAATDIGAEMLFFTPHRIIASNYHREGPGIRDVWQAQTSTKLGPLHDVVKKRKIDIVILCTDTAAPADAALERLRTGDLKAPSWLKPYKIKTKLKQSAPPAIFLVNGKAR